MRVQVAPSILAANSARLAEEVARVAADVAFLHIDVMDGHFVPNLSFGPQVVAALHRATPLPLEVHLMIENPGSFVEPFVRAGASRVIVHAEVLPDLRPTLTRIRALGAAAGVALNPATPPAALGDVLDALDLVLVMTVHPGFSGQTFLPESLDKVRAVRALLDPTGRHLPLEVDGGIDFDNAGPVTRAGATVLVAGTTIFGDPDPAGAARRLRLAAGD